MSSQGLSFQTMAEASPLAMVIWDAGGTIRTANQAFFALLGYLPEEREQLNYWAITAAAQKQRELNHLLTREREPYEKDFLNRDGIYQSVQANGFVLSRGAGDSDLCFAAVMRPIGGQGSGDYTERKRAQRRQNEVLLQLSRSHILSSGDLKAAFAELTEATARGLGVHRVSLWLYDLTRQRIVCQDLYERDRQQHSQGAELLAADFPHYFQALGEERTICADDAHTHPATREFSPDYLNKFAIVSMLEAPLRHQGELVGVLCCEHCREQRAFTHEDVAFAGHMADFVGRAMECADRCRAELALQQLNEELERRVEERTRQVKESTRLVLRLQKEITETQMASGFANEMQHALSSTKIILSKALHPHDSDEERSGTLSAVDLGELLNELFLLVTDRLDAKTLAEVREIFYSLLERTETVSEVLAAADRAVERALNITTQILEYSRLSRTRPGHAECVLPELIAAVVDELRKELDENQIELALELCGPRVLYGTEQHYYSVLKNVLQNACDALGDICEERPRRLSLRYHPAAGGAELLVEDNGTGMAEEVLARLFEPFFTTKPHTGTGLGLAIVRKTLSLYGGVIDLHSTLGEGTRVRLHFPSAVIAPVPGGLP